MKKLLSFVCFFGLIMSAFGQAPDYFHYQAMLRNPDGSPKASEQVSIRVDLIQGQMAGPVVFTEVHDVESDVRGMVTLKIGDGTFFSEIDWELGPYFIGLSVDGQYMGASQLLSVPYALYARRAGHVNDDDPDPTNELQTLSIEEDVLHISNGNSVTLPDVLTPWQSNLNGIHYQRNVGIGNYVTLPSVALDIRRDMTSFEDKALIRLQNADIGEKAYVALGLEAWEDVTDKIFYRSEFLLTSSQYTDRPDFAGMTAIRASGAGITLWSDSPGGALRFYTTPVADGSEERVRIDDQGNMGIGTSAPDARLHVNDGDIYVEDPARGVILRSANGKHWRITVDNTGQLTTTEVSLK